jgi:parvulin-like peptidyl-prolyl isomerase
VYEALQGGADFESVCQRYSTGSDASIGGQVHTAKWGLFEPVFQDMLFNTPVGGITPPTESRLGFIIAKVLEKNQPKKKPYENARAELEKLLRRLEEVRLSKEVSDDVRARHNFQWHFENFAIIIDALPPDRPLTNPPDRAEEVYPLLKLDERDLDMPLVSYDNKSITVRDFSDLYDKASFFERPRRENRFADMRKFLLERVMNELIPIEMKESRIEEEPEIAAALEKKKEKFMVDKLYQDLVTKQTDVSPEEIAAYYNDNLELFRRPEERRFGMIIAGDLQSANEAVKMIKSGEPFDSVSARYSIPELSPQEREGTSFYSRGQHPEADDVAFALEKVGDVSEPVETPRGWMVLKLKERRPERIISADDANTEITRAVQTLKNDERLKTLLEKWRSEIKIEIHEDNLKKAILQPRAPARRAA